MLHSELNTLEKTAFSNTSFNNASRVCVGMCERFCLRALLSLFVKTCVMSA